MKKIALVFRINVDVESIIKELMNNFAKSCYFYQFDIDEELEPCILQNKDACESAIRITDLQKDQRVSHVQPDYILVFGGDGTILRAMHFTLEMNAPVLGFNMGKLGFLTDGNIEDLIPSLNNLLKGKYQKEKRMLLDVSVYRNRVKIVDMPALNDAVIYKGELSKLITIRLFSNKRYVYKARCDGIIISTPTGSTAYSMSSGGPIISPDMEAMVVNSLSPHVLSIRPMVFNAENTLQFKLEEPHSSTVLQVDGINIVQLQSKDKIIIKRSNKKMSFIKLSHKTFYQILRKKLNMGKI
ncbi:MAG TPA: NAD(+)/NADH kinase [Candidatus Cloacimonadota bacterium]|nr:NAD(+)/NADH kinase [Candidatus Cloacimonadota bacterium]HOQ79463.1 NAD(+)/NADH kinase [Candidatus Cloacimonadota bacterium]HPK40417.1 NAD(+)/NADH kinase [Candidatus Cloacimonadota bacterium]